MPQRRSFNIFSFALVTSSSLCSGLAFDYRLPTQNVVHKRPMLWRKGAVLYGIGAADSDIGGEMADPSINDAANILESAGEVSAPIEAGAIEVSEETPFFASNSDVPTPETLERPIESPFFATAVTTTVIPKTKSTASIDETSTRNELEITRRAWLQTGALIFGTTVLGTGAVLHKYSKPTESSKLRQPSTTAKPAPLATPKPPSTGPNAAPSVGRIEPLNLTQVAAQTNINVTMNCPEACVSVDSTTFTKVKTPKAPSWLPSWLSPRPKVVKEISNAELLIAAIIAGSSVDLMRTSLLYPIQTVKTRIQTDIHQYEEKPPSITSRITSLRTNTKKHIDEGNLYAGISPTLLISVPATGVYYGVRDVSKRMLQMTSLNSVEIALAGALIGDVVSLCFRTPADTLALRLQNLDKDAGDWFGDSIKRLPSVIITDLPYLLSKISLNRLLIHGDISIDRYTEFAILTATLAAILTTPFDVARTRILVDSDYNFSNGKDGGSGDGVIQTMRQVYKEGDGGLANLFAGWFERAIFLGLGRAWLEPIQLIGYVGIRDAVLLEWF